MAGRSIEMGMPEGVCEAYVASPAGAGSFPGVLMYMDGIGYRPVLAAMADRLAAAGYVVLLPNLFYRLGRSAPVDVAEVLQPQNRPQLTERVQSLTPNRVRADAEVFIATLQAQPNVDATLPLGIVGYCMGAGMMMRTVAWLGARAGAGAGFHGGRLATDAPDSPHLLADRIRAPLYLGHADEDAGMPAEQQARLAQALHSAGCRFEAELYAGARHGWTMADLPAYDPVAAERHWQHLLALFARALHPR